MPTALSVLQDSQEVTAWNKNSLQGPDLARWLRRRQQEQPRISSHSISIGNVCGINSSSEFLLAFSRGKARGDST